MKFWIDDLFLDDLGIVAKCDRIYYLRMRLDLCGRKKMETRKKYNNKIKERELSIQKYYKYIGSSKQEVLLIFGHSYNDLHSNEWTYRLPGRMMIFSKKYIHLYFKDDILTEVKLSYCGKIENWE